MFSLEKLQMQGRIFQFATCTITALSAVSDGMHYAWTAPVIPMLQNSTDSKIKITKNDVLWLENVYMMGGFIGIPLIVITVNRFGRKKSILLSIFQSLTSWVLIAFAQSVEFVYAARFLSGLAADVGYVSIPMYAMEVADKQIRGFLGSLVYLMMLVGVIVMYSVGPFLSISLSSAVGCSFLVVELCILPFIPESPYYYVHIGNVEAARTSLMKFRRSENVDKELEEISTSINKQLLEKRGLSDLFCVKGNRNALMIGMCLNFAQHFSGYSVILMNLHLILEDASTILASSTAAIIYSAVMLIAALLASLAVDKIGRKVLLCISCVLTGLSILILALYFTLKSSGVNVATQNWIPILSIMSYAFSFKFGLGLVSLLIPAEIYPTYIKALGMAVGDTVYSLSSMLSVYVYQTLKDLYGIHVPFFLFVVCCFSMAIFSALVVPETKGKTLEEIHLQLNAQAKSKNSADVTDVEETRL